MCKYKQLYFGSCTNFTLRPCDLKRNFIFWFEHFTADSLRKENSLLSGNLLVSLIGIKHDFNEFSHFDSI